MEIISSRERMSSIARRLQREAKRTIGLVPTMGALHKGHLSLVQKAREMCDVVVASVFVNPTQFGPAEDFKSYPRDLTRDASLLAEHNVDYVFAPAVEEVFPAGFATFVSVDGLSEQLEGKSRPGHFRGVATVVAILLNTVEPQFAFFGQKDAQQAIVIKRLVKDLAFSTEVVVLPTVREESGLAMSSRNAYLNDEQRGAASVLNRALRNARAAFEAGEHNPLRLIETIRATIDKQPLARIDYVSVNDAETLEVVDRIEDRSALISLAVFIGDTRLIDNIVLNDTARAKDSSSATA